MPSEIDEIIQQVKSGNQAAFKKLVEAYQSYAYKLAYRILCDEEEAKDVVQDSFVKIWKNIRAFDTKHKFTTWMYKIVTHTAIDRYRAIKKSSKVRLEEINLSFDTISGHNLLIDFENRQLGETIKYLAENLPEKQRLVFVLRDLQGIDSIEVQDILGMTATMVKSNLYNARTVVKQKLAKIMEYERS
jgi:RNA polymerase sigma-70 factor (ECF subfamily)